MSISQTTGLWSRVSNSFSQPVAGTAIDQVTADAFFDDEDTALNALLGHLSILPSGDRTGSDVNTAQAIFGTAQDAFTAVASTTYEFEALYWIVRAAGTTSHTTAVLFAGTATFTSINYLAQVTNPTGNVLANVQQIWGAAATALVLTAANTSATENLLIKLRGLMRVNGAGTIIPQFIYSVAPGGAPTIKADSFFKMRAVGSNTIATVGDWA